MESEHLPEDMIVEILLRLDRGEAIAPIPLRLQGLAFNHLVSQIRQIALRTNQLQSSKPSATDSSSSTPSPPDWKSIDFKKPSSLDDAPPRKLTFPPSKLPLQAVDIVGACNGIYGLAQRILASYLGFWNVLL